MDPQLKSIISTVGVWLAGAIASWAASKGFITADQSAQVGNALITLGGVVVAAGLAWWKARQHTQQAMITAVNKADNGVKVVASASTGAPEVNHPLK